MFDFLKKWFSKPARKADDKKRSKSDEIRKYAKGKFVTPARMKKVYRVSFGAEEIEKGMGLGGKYPMVCHAIDSHKFADFARVELIKREGSSQGATARWIFKIKP